MINEGLFFEIQTKDELSIALADGIKTTSTSSTKVIMMLRNRSVSFSSSLAKAVSNQNIQVLNIGSEISSLSMRNIDLQTVLESVRERILGCTSSFCLLDNCEILFDEYNELNVLLAFRHLSKFKGIVGCVDASIVDGCLVYGKPSQPGYQKIKNINDVFIIDTKGVFV